MFIYGLTGNCGIRVYRHIDHELYNNRSLFYSPSRYGNQVLIVSRYIDDGRFQRIYFPCHVPDMISFLSPHADPDVKQARSQLFPNVGSFYQNTLKRISGL
jgi:hypothetical protein